MRRADQLAAGYLVAVAGLGALPQEPLARALAFSPDALLRGRVWLLPLSGLVVDGDTTTQVAELLAVAVPLVAVAGGAAFWRAAIAGHVGSTLLAYAAVGSVALVNPDAVADLIHAPDYGISCVVTGSLGALAALAPRRTGWAPALVALGLLSRTPGLASLEHVLAFGLGAASVALGRLDVREVLGHVRAQRRADRRALVGRGHPEPGEQLVLLAVLDPAGRPADGQALEEELDRTLPRVLARGSGPRPPKLGVLAARRRRHRSAQLEGAARVVDDGRRLEPLPARALPQRA